MKDESLLIANNLDSNLAEFKKFHATRKLKGAAKAIIAMNRMKNITNSLKAAAASNEEGDTDARTAEVTNVLK